MGSGRKTLRILNFSTAFRWAVKAHVALYAGKSPFQMLKSLCVPCVHRGGSRKQQRRTRRQGVRVVALCLCCYPSKFYPCLLNSFRVDHVRVLCLYRQLFLRPHLVPHPYHSLSQSLVCIVSCFFGLISYLTHIKSFPAFILSAVSSASSHASPISQSFSVFILDHQLLLPW
jgi:hypothetical protein